MSNISGLDQELKKSAASAQELEFCGIRPTRAGTAQLSRLNDVILRSCEYFLKTQNREGYWWEELESNTTITSEYIMLLHLLGKVDPERQKSMVKYLLGSQLSSGAWPLYYGDEGNLSITIEAYFALRLAGEPAESKPLRSAAAYILSHGGIEAARTFTKIWLALFSQYDWNKVPSMPVELVLLPSHFYFNIYEFSSWARSTIVPLSIVMTLRPGSPLCVAPSLGELQAAVGPALSPRESSSCLHRLFYIIDRFVKTMERRPFPSLRKKAIKAAKDWVLDHQEKSGDWGGIQPAMIYSILALHYLGYPADHDVIRRGLEALELFCKEDEAGLRLQSCISPVWDTALTAMALLDAGIPPEHPSLFKAASWLVKNQVCTGGDWQVKSSFALPAAGLSSS